MRRPRSNEIRLSHSWESNPVVDDAGIRYGTEHLDLHYDSKKKRYEVRFVAADPNWGRHWMPAGFSGRKHECSGDLNKALEYYLKLAERYAPLEKLTAIKKEIEAMQKRARR